MRSKRKSVREKTKGPFALFTAEFLKSHARQTLSGNANKLLLDLASQYTGYNNGDFCITWTLMEKRGWKSRDTLNKARKELLEARIIEISRQGGRRKASLYALTIYPVHDCKGKLDIAPTEKASHLWRLAEPSIGAHLKQILSDSVARSTCQMTTIRHADRVNDADRLTH